MLRPTRDAWFAPLHEPSLTTSARKTEAGRTHLERRKEAERRILAAALTIVAERGLAALTLQEAGERAGYSRALPAHYYGTREHMLAALVTHVVARYREQQAAAGYDHLTGIEALAANVRHMVSEARLVPGGMKAFYEVTDAAAGHPGLGPAVERMNLEMLDDSTAQLAAAVAAGEMRPDLDPRMEAVLYHAYLRGLMIRWLNHQADFDLEAAGEAMIAGLKRSWAPT